MVKGCAGGGGGEAPLWPQFHQEELVGTTPSSSPSLGSSVVPGMVLLPQSLPPAQERCAAGVS